MRSARSPFLALAFAFLAWMSAASAADLSEPLILVAKPGLQNSFYGATVLVVTPLDEGLHVGFIVNRPTTVPLAQVLPERGPAQKIADPVYLGGPLDVQMIFALVQRKDSPGDGSIEMMPGLYAAFETPTVDRIIESESDHARFMAGLVAWRPGELQEEIERGAWFVVKPDAAVVMQKPEGLWEDLVRQSEIAANAI